MSDIKELVVIVGDSLTGATGVTTYSEGRIYYKFLPDNFRKADLQLVFEVRGNESYSTFDDYNYSEDYELIINVVHKSSLELYSVVPEIKKVIIPMRGANVRYTDFIDDFLVWNANQGVYNLKLRFKIIFDK